MWVHIGAWRAWQKFEHTPHVTGQSLCMCEGLLTHWSFMPQMAHACVHSDMRVKGSNTLRAP